MFWCVWQRFASGRGAERQRGGCGTRAIGREESSARGRVARELREATLTPHEWITAAKVGEMCRRAPRRSLLLSSVAQPSAAQRRARHSPGARGPQRRRADHTALPYSPPAPVTVPGLQWYYQVHTRYSFSDSRGESRNRVADKRCATSCARNSRGLALSRRKRVASGEVAQAPGSRRVRSYTHTPWIALAILDSLLI